MMDEVMNRVGFRIPFQMRSKNIKHLKKNAKYSKVGKECMIHSPEFSFSTKICGACVGDNVVSRLVYFDKKLNVYKDYF